MDAYVIAAPISGIPGTLTEVFPGCQLRRWEPTERRLTGKLKDAVDLLEQAIAAGIDWIPFKAIRDAIGVPRENFAKLVTKQAEWPDSIAALGMVVERGSRNSLALRLLPDALIAE